MSGLKVLKQLLLPGVKTAKGAERIPGKPGFYDVDPSAANVETRNILKRASRRAIDEGDLAESPSGVPSTRGRANARGAYMLGGALNELRYAADAGGSIARPVKGLVYVDKNGNVRAGAALNKEKAAEYLSDATDLDFTKAHPNYLEYVSTTTPDVRGSELLRMLQERYGDDMVFQVATPKKNVPIYEAMGARRMPLRNGDDALGGDEGLPAFRIEKRIPERSAPPELVGPPRQMGLPGFKKGGWLPPLSSGRGKRDTSRSVMDPEGTIYPPTASEMGEALASEAVLAALPIGGLTKLGKRLAKGAVRSAPVAVPAVAAASSDEAEAADIKKMLMGVYRGYAGKKETPLVYYHGGTYVPGEKITQPLYLTRDKDFADSYVWAKGGNLSRLVPEPRKTAPQSLLDELAAEYVPDNAKYGYTPASALDSALHGESSVGRLVYELGRTPRNYDSVRAFDVGFGGPGQTPEGEVLAMLPGSTVKPAPTGRVYVSPQKAVADRYAKKRAQQTGDTPHVEMLLVDPFAGKKYGHATIGSGAEPPLPTMARELELDDVVDRFKLYRRGGLVALKGKKHGA